MTSKKTSVTPDARRRIKSLIQSTGWIPDPPSPHDFTADHPDIIKLLKKTGAILRRKKLRLLPSKVDLRPWCSPVQFQGQYNTCTAHVVTSMLAVLENKAHGRYVPASRLFLYQVTKRIIGSDQADPGVYLRQMMGCLVLIGVPPETYFKYLDTSIKNDPRLSEAPDAFCYSIAHDMQAVRYVRLDPLGDKPKDVLNRIRMFLAAGFGSSIGFPLYMSALEYATKSGDLPMPKPGEDAVGSHAVLLVGFDNDRVIQGSEKGCKKSTGAFLIKNSWDTTWGDKGYGWLPYDYLLDGLAHDVWTLMQARWVETDQFQIAWDQPAPGA